MLARTLGCTVDELSERMSADEFQGHLEDMGLIKGNDEQSITEDSMKAMLGLQ